MQSVFYKKRIDLNRHGWIAIAAATMAGLLIPLYLDMLGNGMGALLALPMLLILGGLLVVDRKALLLLILISRAAGDMFLEMMKSSLGSQSMGVGGLINACVIALSLMLVLERPQAVPLKMARAWIAFFVTAIFGVALSADKGEAVRLLLTWLSNFAVFISAFYVVREEREFRFCFRLVLWSSVIPAAYALYDLAAHWGADFRLQSTFTHANIFAFYLVLVIFCGFYLIKSSSETSTKTKDAGLALYVFYLLALLLMTQTRSAWIACVTVFAAYGLLFERRYLLYLVLISLFALLIPAVQERIVDLSMGNDMSHQAKLNSFAWRVSLWESALSWMQPARYLFGYGIGGFRLYAPEFFELSGGFNWDAHNVYVQWLFDVGMLGLLSYLWIFARLVFLLQPLFRIDRLGAFIVVAQVVSYLLVSFSDNMLFYLVFNWYFWFIVGAACSYLYVRKAMPAHATASSGTSDEAERARS